MHITLNRFFTSLCFCVLWLLALSPALYADDVDYSDEAKSTLTEPQAEEDKVEDVDVQTKDANLTNHFPEASYWEGRTFYAYSWTQDGGKTVKVSIIGDEGISYTLINNILHIPQCDTGILLVHSPKIGDPVHGARLFDTLPYHHTDKLYTLVGGEIQCDEQIDPLSDDVEEVYDNDKNEDTDLEEKDNQGDEQGDENDDEYGKSHEDL